MRVDVYDTRSHAEETRCVSIGGRVLGPSLCGLSIALVSLNQSDHSLASLDPSLPFILARFSRWINFEMAGFEWLN